MKYIEEHYQMVKKGAVSISDWRKKHPNERLQLRRADFTHTDLSACNLDGADLEFADFRWADLQRVRLAGANLVRADFHKADLSYSNLLNADLRFANLEDCVLKRAVLSGATIGRTRLLDTDLTDAIGLAEVIHERSSFINNETIVKSHPLPDSFLRGCGMFAPKQATILRVVIGSPGDVLEERSVVRDTILDWNDRFMEREGVVLKPVMWEHHAVPEFSTESINHGPQHSINRQLIDKGHLLVCIFWWRIGTKTQKAQSGTIEEINEFVKTGRPVMLYFCTKPLPQNHDQEQWQELKTWKEKVQKMALVGEFENQAELQEKLSSHLTQEVDRLLTKYREKQTTGLTEAETQMEASEFFGSLANSLLKIYILSLQVDERHINPWLDELKSAFEMEAATLRELASDDSADQIELVVDLKEVAKKCDSVAKTKLILGPESWEQFVKLVKESGALAFRVFKARIEDTGITKNSADDTFKEFQKVVRQLDDLMERLPELVEIYDFDTIKMETSRIGETSLLLSFLGLDYIEGFKVDPLRDVARSLHLIETKILFADGGKSIGEMVEDINRAATQVKLSMAEVN